MGALDRIGTTAAKTGAKKSTKVAAVIPNEMKGTVDDIIQLKARIKADEAALSEKEMSIIDHVRQQQDTLGFAGSFTKSLEVLGNTGSLLYNTQDRFSVPQTPEAQTELQGMTGDLYAEFFEQSPTLTIKAAVLSDDATLERIFAACETAQLDLGAIFEKTVKVVAKDGLDEKQYRLRTAEKLAQFRALVRQNKPALK